MKKHALYFLTTMLIASSFFGCARFSKKTFRNEFQKLDRKDISGLEGNYSLNPRIKYVSDKPEDLDLESKITDSLIHYNAYQFMVTPNLSSKKNLYQRKTENVDRLINLKFQNEKLLSIKVYEKGVVIKDTVLSGKYKKGMFYLDNKFVKCHGIPFLFGGCQSNKRRIGLSKNRGLLVNEAYDNTGALLFFFWAGNDYNVAYEYPRK